ncbi:MAG: DUF3460 family protein [Formivibrio sp.]|nr:DUF3460 family protein [Formivibrio sp.]
MFGQDVRYVSEFNKFMNDFLKKNPEVAQGQIEGRSLLWEKAPLDLDERQRNEASRVKQKAYPYQAD